MIIDGLISMLLAVLSFVLGLMPSWAAPTLDGFTDTASLDGVNVYGVGVPLSDVGQYVGALNAWVDLTLMIDVITLALGVWVAVSAAKGLLWLYEHLPFKST